MADPTNAEIAAALDELGDLYELDGAVVYRVVAYRQAAQSVRDSPRSVEQLVRDGRVTEIPGIGKTLETKLQTLIETGDTTQAQKLRAQFPSGLIAMMHLRGTVFDLASMPHYHPTLAEILTHPAEELADKIRARR